MTNTSKHLPPQTEYLVDLLLDVREDEQPSVFRLAAVAMALTEMGITARLQQIPIALDPEQWTRPEFLMALNIQGVVYGGLGRYGWETLADVLHTQQQTVGHHRDFGRASTIDPEKIVALNPTKQAEWEVELKRARTIIEEHDTIQPIKSIRVKP